MEEQVIRLRCLELAIDRVNREQPSNFKEAVADLQDWFYNRIIGKVDVKVSPEKTEPKTLHLPTAKDKPLVAPKK